MDSHAGGYPVGDLVKSIEVDSARCVEPVQTDFEKNVITDAMLKLDFNEEFVGGVTVQSGVMDVRLAERLLSAPRGMGD